MSPSAATARTGAASDPAGSPLPVASPSAGPPSPQVRAEAVIDTDAIASNTRVLLARLRGHNPTANLMAVVKADGYGHGAVESARAALRGGAASLGVATPTEALELRAAGIEAPVLAWLWPAGEDIGPALAAGIDLGISSIAHLDAVLAAAGATRPKIHLKIDTGLGRNGVGPAELEATLHAIAAAQDAGRVEVAGLMSHLASADVPGDAVRGAADPRVPGRDRPGRTGGNSRRAFVIWRTPRPSSTTRPPTSISAAAGSGSMA